MPYFYEFWQENPLSKRDASGILGETLYDGCVWRAPGNGKQAGAFRGGRAGDRKRTCKGWRIYFMKMLEDRIRKDGIVREGNVLKVDSFINHQMDPILMKSIAVEFVRRFASTNINKVMTIEASGIAPAIMVGYLLELPVVFAKKKKPVTMENMLTTSVYSFTKDRSYDVCVSKDFLQKGDRVLFIDDFLANGNAAKGIIDLVEKAGAELAGMGFIIEKSFQHGGDYLRNAGIRIESLAIIDSLDNCEIKIR